MTGSEITICLTRNNYRRNKHYKLRKKVSMSIRDNEVIILSKTINFFIIIVYSFR